MALRIQSSNLVAMASPAIALDEGDYLYIAPGVLVATSAAGGTGIGCASYAAVEVHGSVIAQVGISIGQLNQLSQVLVGADGQVSGAFSYVLAVIGLHFVFNYGHINGLTGSSGVFLSGQGGLFQNDGVVVGGSYGVHHDAIPAGDAAVTYNFGRISAAQNGFAYFTSASAGAELVLNAGLMQGSVQLGDGTGNVFDSRLGQVIGTIAGGAGDDTILGPVNGGRIDGGDGNDLIAATGSAAVTLNGGAGSDVLMGAGGDDVLIGGAGRNQLWGGAGSDTASYEGETSSVQANLGSFGALVAGLVRDTYNSIENLIGGDAADVLVGNSGANRLTGGRGSDQLYGFGGPDTFVYRSKLESTLALGYDTIADFEKNIDKIDVSALFADPAQTVIVSAGSSTALYIEADPSNPGYEVAIAFFGANAITLSDIIF